MPVCECDQVLERGEIAIRAVEASANAISVLRYGDLIGLVEFPAFHQEALSGPRLKSSFRSGCLRRAAPFRQAQSKRVGNRLCRFHSD